MTYHIVAVDTSTDTVVDTVDEAASRFEAELIVQRCHYDDPRPWITYRVRPHPSHHRGEIMRQTTRYLGALDRADGYRGSVVRVHICVDEVTGEAYAVWQHGWLVYESLTEARAGSVWVPLRITLDDWKAAGLDGRSVLDGETYLLMMDVWTGATCLRPVLIEPPLCLPCSTVAGEAVEARECSSLTHPKSA